jgi:hypothetical protein
MGKPYEVWLRTEEFDLLVSGWDSFLDGIREVSSLNSYDPEHEYILTYEGEELEWLKQ